MSALRKARENAGLSQERLAELAGTSQPQINKLEHGQRKLTLDWAVRLAPHLGIHPEALLGGPSQPAQPHAGTIPSGMPRTPMGTPMAAPAYAQMPVRSACRGGIDQEMFLEDGPIDWIAKPDYLKNARDPYAMYVVGESMMPRFRPAQLLHVNPHKPPAPGSGVVVVKRSKAVLIKEFVRRTQDGGVVLHEYQPMDREFTVPAEELDAMHTVVGLQEP
ncbi:XRE family transcriptional regulator [Azospirillum soli]|uniref:XRE family transcriptional regulator n=1 Tax=Azospirillum soli TaxID=1304799 RepID=UPI001AE6F481|nr:LexA family transcriptional regulator [Azospirillum soli]MBP2314906.1 phage repressor protein C with HTH and peptisase S24 domain [Azospirillum soli]